MEPKQLFRSQDGGTFEDPLEAKVQSVEFAASNLIELIHDKNNYNRQGMEIMAIAPDVIEAMKELADAMEGKLIKTYNLKK
jgi:hypothetical protein